MSFIEILIFLKNQPNTKPNLTLHPDTQGLYNSPASTSSFTDLLYIVYGLTLYETHRQPRPLIIDESPTTIQVRTLNVELTCPVCLGILHNTMTVMECLHRFCEGCISKSLRLG